MEICGCKGSTLRVEKIFCARTTQERIEQLRADECRKWLTQARRTHARLLQQLKSFDSKQTIKKSWYLSALKSSAVLSPEGYEQQALEVTIARSIVKQRTYCIVKDDATIFIRAVTLTNLQTLLDSEVPTAKHVAGEPVIRAQIENTRHVVSGYRLIVNPLAQLRTSNYYAPGSVLSAPDHPALTLKKWSQIEVGRGPND